MIYKNIFNFVFNNIILHYLLVINAQANDFVLDYSMANKNTKGYDQVPQNELIVAKYQAAGPRYFSDFPLRGKGFIEPLINEMILKLRANKIDTYVDYFTTAKFGFYLSNPSYEICAGSTRTLLQYKNLLKQKQQGPRLYYYGIPYYLLPAVGVVALGQKKKHLYSKHLWPNTDVYNTKSLLNDPDLFTAQITASTSSIKEYIYLNEIDSMILRPEYKRNVYDFVASDAIQIPLMLKGKRMDWVDMSMFNDFYIKKLKIGPEEIILAPLSNSHPNSLSINNIKVVFPFCVGKNHKIMSQALKVMNDISKKRRTNLKYWTAVIKQYAKDMDIPYQDPQLFYYTKTNFEWKKELDRGDFDRLDN